MTVFATLIFGILATAAEVTPEQVLKTAWSDRAYQSHELIQGTDSVSPVRTVEAILGHKSKPYKEDELEVGLKFVFKSYAEWKSGREKGLPQKILKDSALGWALRDRYNTLLIYEINKRKQKILSDLIQTSEDQLKALSLALKAGRATSKNFVSARSELFKLKREQTILEQERDLLKKKIGRWLPDQTNLDFAQIDLLSVKEIEEAVKGSVVSENSLSVKLVGEEITTLEQEFTIVRGREKQWFKALEVSQSQSDSETRYEVQATFQIPFLSSEDLAKQKQNEIILKKALKQKEFEEYKDSLHTLKTQILNQIDLYKIMVESNGLVASRNLPDPLANIDRKIAASQEKLELLTQQQEITLLYLSFLLETEVLMDKPGINHLSAGKKAILL